MEPELSPYTMEDFNGFDAAYTKEALTLSGYTVEFTMLDGTKGKAKNDRVVVSTSPAVGAQVTDGATVTVTLRMADETVTGIDRKLTYLLCKQKAEHEFPAGFSIRPWDVAATEEVATLTGEIALTNDLGHREQPQNFICSLSEVDGRIKFTEFSVR